MSRQMTCPKCGEDEELTGERTDEGIFISCDSCGTRWARDKPYTCATCGGEDIHIRAQALTQYSRGTQLSIVGFHDIPLCARCDEEMLVIASQNKPVPSQYESAAVRPREDGSSSDPTFIIPLGG